MMKKTILILLISLSITSYGYDNSALEKRVTVLEKEVGDLKEMMAPLASEMKLKTIISEQRKKAKERMFRDRQKYSDEELMEIESLYQVANKKWNSEEGKESLKKLISKYTDANRTGCATLYLGQMSHGSEKEEYLKKAITAFSDCFYGDGVQVGAYARYQLAHYYKNIGSDNEANNLFKELKKMYPQALTHKGQLLSKYLNE